MRTAINKFILSVSVILASVFYVLSQSMSNGKGVYPLPSTNTPSTAQLPAGSKNYKDGQYTGSVADAYYGNIQVKAIIQNGKLADVQFLDYPQDRRTSININTSAMPVLKSEAIQAQSANVDIVTGATDTSQAFQQSLSSALSQAVV